MTRGQSSSASDQEVTRGLDKPDRTLLLQREALQEHDTNVKTQTNQSAQSAQSTGRDDTISKASATPAHSSVATATVLSRAPTHLLNKNHRLYNWVIKKIARDADGLYPVPLDSWVFTQLRLSCVAKKRRRLLSPSRSPRRNIQQMLWMDDYGNRPASGWASMNSTKMETMQATWANCETVDKPHWKHLRVRGARYAWAINTEANLLISRAVGSVHVRSNRGRRRKIYFMLSYGMPTYRSSAQMCRYLI